MGGRQPIMKLTIRFPATEPVSGGGDPPRAGEFVTVEVDGKERRGRVVPGGVTRIYGSEPDSAIVQLEDCPIEGKRKL